MVEKTKLQKKDNTAVEEQVPEAKKLVVTQAADWNKSNTNERLLELPSGAVFKVRNVSLANMVTKGIVPLSITTQLLQMKKNIEKAVKDGKSEGDGIQEKDMNDLDGICRKFAVLAIVDPIVVENVTDNLSEICVHDIDFTDIMTIFMKCMRGGAEQFASFF